MSIVNVWALLAVAWLDKKPPNFLPTIHPPEFPLWANGLLGLERQESEGKVEMCLALHC